MARWINLRRSMRNLPSTCEIPSPFLERLVVSLICQIGSDVPVSLNLVFPCFHDFQPRLYPRLLEPKIWGRSSGSEVPPFGWHTTSSRSYQPRCRRSCCCLIGRVKRLKALLNGTIVLSVPEIIRTGAIIGGEAARCQHTGPWASVAVHR